MIKNITTNTVHQTAQLINYAPESIVSKEIIHTPTGSITLFAISQGQKISEHTAPFDATVFITHGEAQITISGHTHTVKAGEMIIMPANEPHALEAQSSFKMVLIMIR